MTDQMTSPSGGPLFSAEVRDDGIVALSGELDISTVDRLDEVLAEAEAASPEQLVLDMRSLAFMDSSGLRSLLKAHMRAQADGSRRVTLICPTGPIRRVLEISGAASVVDVVDELPAPGA